MKSSLLFETGETTTLEIAVQIFKANYHWHNLLHVLTERQFWNMLVDLVPTHFLFFLNFYSDVLLENHLTKLWREALNVHGKLAAFFPAPHQPPALVWRSSHPGSGGITTGSLVSNMRLSFVVSSIEEINQILFQRGSWISPFRSPQLQPARACEGRTWWWGLR